MLQLRSQLVEAKQNGISGLQGLTEQLQGLSTENADLKTRIDFLNQELMNKNNQLRKGEMQQS